MPPGRSDAVAGCCINSAACNRNAVACRTVSSAGPRSLSARSPRNPRRPAARRRPAGDGRKLYRRAPGNKGRRATGKKRCGVLARFRVFQAPIYHAPRHRRGRRLYKEAEPTAPGRGSAPPAQAGKPPRPEPPRPGEPGRSAAFGSFFPGTASPLH